jgi:hypothetical protein
MIEMCISGHADCRFFLCNYWGSVLLNLSLLQLETWGWKTTTGSMSPTIKMIACPGPWKAFVNFRRRTISYTSLQESPAPKAI